MLVLDESDKLILNNEITNFIKKIIKNKQV